MAVRLDRNTGGGRGRAHELRHRWREGERRLLALIRHAGRHEHPAIALPVWMVRGYWAVNAGDLAAALAFNALIAVIPSLLLLVSLGGFALQRDTLLPWFIQTVLWAVPREDAQAALEVVLKARRNSGWFGALSLLGFAWVGANFVNCLERSMNRVYGVPNRHFVHERVRGFLLVLVLAVLFLLAALAATLPTLFVRSDLGAFFSSWTLASTRNQLLSYATSFVTSLALFLVVYRLLPNAGQRLRDVWPGSLVAALLLVTLLQAFPLYLRWVGGVNRYGQYFGFIPLVVAWFALLAHLLLFGTYINATVQRRRKRAAGGRGQGAGAGSGGRPAAGDGRRAVTTKAGPAVQTVYQDRDW